MGASSIRIISNKCQELLCLNKDDVLVFEFIVSAIIATMCEKLNEPVWSYIIGPAGSCKTESLKPLQGYEKCIFLSSLTENWLMSGYRDEQGNDPSLLNSMDGKVLIVKDISSLTNLPPRTVNKIWGDLRDAFDQTASKASGISGMTEYRARFGVIMLGTGILDIFAEEHQQLGERFLAFRLHRTPLTLEQRQTLAMHVSKTMGNKSKWQSDLRHTTQTEIGKLASVIAKTECIPTIPESMVYLVMLMGNLLSLLRTTPVRGMAESPELPTRVGQQLLNLGSAHAIADGRKEWDESDIALVRRVTVDTLPAFRSRLIRVLYERGPHRPFTTISRMMEKCEIVRKEIVCNILSQYVYSHVVEPDETGESYRLSQKIYNAFNEVKIF